MTENEKYTKINNNIQMTFPYYSNYQVKTTKMWPAPT